MKLVCNISVGNRALPTLSINTHRKHVKSTLALCRNPNGNTFCILLFTSQSKNGTKYQVKDNIRAILTKFINEGKATIQFKTPEHDLYVQADVIPLKGFLHLLKRVLENKVGEKELTCSSMSVTPVKNTPSTKLTILNRSEYPSKGFPRNLEVLRINEISRCSLDRGILQLTKLKVLDLSHNCIEVLPREFSNMPNLGELNLSFNQLGKASVKEWCWLGGRLANVLHILDISSNGLRILPDQIVKLHQVRSLHVDHNELRILPSGIGKLKELKEFIASHNSLDSLPGSCKNWNLQNLDLSHNNFPTYPPHCALNLPKFLPLCTLKEWAARQVLSTPLPYSPATLPYTVCDYLDHAHYCLCGRACFNVYIRHTHILLVSAIAHTFTLSTNGTSRVPIDCYYCSVKCLISSCLVRERHPVIR